MTQILGADGKVIQSKQSMIPRAERRRMLKDKMFHQKNIAGSEHVDEYSRLLAYGQIIINDMVGIQMRMAGLGHSPKNVRMQTQERLTAQWNENTEKLEGVQAQMEELEKAKTAKPLIEV